MTTNYDPAAIRRNVASGQGIEVPPDKAHDIESIIKTLPKPLEGMKLLAHAGDWILSADKQDTLNNAVLLSFGSPDDSVEFRGLYAVPQDKMPNKDISTPERRDIIRKHGIKLSYEPRQDNMPLDQHPGYALIAVASERGREFAKDVTHAPQELKKIEARAGGTMRLYLVPEVILEDCTNPRKTGYDPFAPKIRKSILVMGAIAAAEAAFAAAARDYRPEDITRAKIIIEGEPQQPLQRKQHAASPRLSEDDTAMPQGGQLKSLKYTGRAERRLEGIATEEKSYDPYSYSVNTGPAAKTIREIMQSAAFGSNESSDLFAYYDKALTLLRSQKGKSGAAASEIVRKHYLTPLAKHIIEHEAETCFADSFHAAYNTPG